MEFFDWRSIFPELERIELDVVKSELNDDQWQDWPERTLYDQTPDSEWKVIPFCATFPGNDPSMTQWNQSAVRRFPKTVALLKQIPGLRTAGFSRLGPYTALKYHRGWASLSNHVLRCHLPVKVPEGEILCGVVVNDVFQFHREGEWIVFDDSKLHKAFNFHPSEDRIVLLLDIQRPSTVPRGTSTVGMTCELTAFLSAFR